MSERVTKKQCLEAMKPAVTGLEHLPRDVLVECIFSQLSYRDLKRCVSVCRAWRFSLRRLLMERSRVEVKRFASSQRCLWTGAHTLYRCPATTWDRASLELNPTGCHPDTRRVEFDPITNPSMDAREITGIPNVPEIQFRGRDRPWGALFRGGRRDDDPVVLDRLSHLELEDLCLRLQGGRGVCRYVHLERHFPSLQSLVVANSHWFSNSSYFTLMRQRFMSTFKSANVPLRLPSQLTRLDISGLSVGDLDLARLTDLRQLRIAVPSGALSQDQANCIQWPSTLEELILMPGSRSYHQSGYETEPVRVDLSLSPSWTEMTRLSNLMVSMSYAGGNLADLCLDSVLYMHVSALRVPMHRNLAGPVQRFDMTTRRVGASPGMRLGTLQIERSNDTKIEGRLPLSLKQLHLPNGYDYDLGSVLPASLEHWPVPTDYAGRIDDGTGETALPLVSGPVFLSHRIQGPVARLLGTMTACTELRTHSYFDLPVAEGLRSMTSLRRLSFGMSFNQPLAGCLPPSLEGLVLESDFNQDLTGTLPPRLRQLSIFSTRLSIEIKDDCLPPLLEEIMFPLTYRHDPSRLFQQPLLHLTKLYLPKHFQGPLAAGALSQMPSLETLSTGACYKHCIADEVPTSLKHIKLGDQYTGDSAPLFAKLRRLESFELMNKRQEDWTHINFPPGLKHVYVSPQTHLFVDWSRLSVLQIFNGPQWMKQDREVAKLRAEAIARDFPLRPADTTRAMINEH